MYNITGWSGGGRRPLTYNLMPGQFRNTRVNVFPNQTIINNNIGGFGGCYDYGDCDCGGGMPKWLGWMMGGGMLLNGLGSILSCFWGGGGGGGKTNVDVKVDLTAAKNDVKALKEQYPDAKISVMSDGSFMLNGQKYDSIDDVIEALQTPQTPKVAKEPTQKENDNKNEILLTGFLSARPELIDKCQYKDGKFILKGEPNQEFETLDKLKEAVSKKVENKKKEQKFTPVLTKGLAGMTDAATEEKYFKDKTGQEPYKITTNANGITITEVNDKGNNTSKTGSINITGAQLTELMSATGKEITLSNFSGKAAKAKNLGGYLQIQVGEQTYIVGKDMKGYQFENGNVIGYSDANWRRGS